MISLFAVSISTCALNNPHPTPTGFGIFRTEIYMYRTISFLMKNSQNTLHVAVMDEM